MHLQISKSRNAESFYIIKSYRDRRTGKNSSKVVERLGTRSQLEEKLGQDVDIEAWARDRARALTIREKAGTSRISVDYDPASRIDPGVLKVYRGGYLFLQSIYHQLGLDRICKEIARSGSFEYDLDAILSRLIYGRILKPASKMSTVRFADTLIERPAIECHQVYRALEVLADQSDLIQAKLYRNSSKVASRKDTILYYDCTNFFFEITEEDELRKYSRSKDHKPNPVVQMGLFMDAEGIPLACSINAGNTNEQTTLIPLEEKILSDFDLSRFVVVTDAGLSSTANRMFNAKGDRQFITTQSVKVLKDHLMRWAMDRRGWRICGSDAVFDLGEVAAILDEGQTDPAAKGVLYDKVFYKRRPIREEVGGHEPFEQCLIVTFSFKYRAYQRKVRTEQIDRALRAIEKDKSRINRKGQNDFRRLIKQTSVTKDGEVADTSVYAIDADAVAREARYDGFYGLCTSLDADDDIEGILKVSSGRWQIEECFRILKSEFRSRPAYLSRADRITAHFLTCFIALLVFRLLEKKLGGHYTCSQILDTLKSMDFKDVKGEGFEPLYVRSELTDKLHEAFGFHTDYEIVTGAKMKEIIKKTKEP
jgi:hypothetical protein